MPGRFAVECSRKYGKLYRGVYIKNTGLKIFGGNKLGLKVKISLLNIENWKVKGNIISASPHCRGRF